MVAAVAVTVLVVVVLVTTMLGKKDGQTTSVAPGQDGGNAAAALQRAVADSSNPSVASIAGAWGYYCNGQALMVVVQLDGSALYSPNRHNVLLNVEARSDSTVATVRSSDDANTTVGTTMALSVQGGRLQIARSGSTVSLLPIDMEGYDGEALC